jgi:ribonuclease PH
MTRSDNRSPSQLRPVQFDTHYSQYAEGSVLARFGGTHVLCNVTVDESLPGWLKRRPEPHGWLTAEYALLPRSTQRRTRREQRWPRGRTQEISRLIGRSLRIAVDLEELGQRQLIVDCDVLQADGGTRTAAVSGGWIAVYLALQELIGAGQLPETVLRRQIAAVSVGIVDGEPLLDLAYEEDVTAEVDLNVVMTASGDIIEIQGTAEREPFSRDRFETLLDLAASGIADLARLQWDAVATGRGDGRQGDADDAGF